ncbi:hypothetical protein GMST_34910 [Geomonas silvestris]|uniref:DUF2007 domain-containing protein n=1 Tax=Geomonas silvestris TaxID=2740184 RepID=A0A6V8MMD6_9BACT|nr:DUF2007 domain-containing protein [Geomonas silvestris]GFO61166.1 hypothetical protein GMST_34910 [Geomonas silvestris]
MINVYSPKDELELSLIRGILEAEGIRYCVFNDHFGSMRVGPQIDLLNKKTIMVAPEDLERTRHIISDIVARSAPAADDSERYSLGQKIRMVVQTLFFGWFIPERKHRK